MSEFWLNDFSVLYDPKYVMDFFPSSVSSNNEKMNSIVRLSFYISLVLSLYYKSNYFYIFVFGLLFTLIINKNSENFEINDNREFQNENCTMPTLENPFMNVNYIDYLDNPNRPPACDPNDPEIKKDIDDNFYNNLFRNVDDLWGKMNSQRQFYTMPSTTIPNDREAFANWCYKSGPTCKENGAACLKYEDLRAKRPVYPNPFQNPFGQ